MSLLSIMYVHLSEINEEGKRIRGYEQVTGTRTRTYRSMGCARSLKALTSIGCRVVRGRPVRVASRRTVDAKSAVVLTFRRSFSRVLYSCCAICVKISIRRDGIYTDRIIILLVSEAKPSHSTHRTGALWSLSFVWTLQLGCVSL